MSMRKVLTTTLLIISFAEDQHGVCRDHSLLQWAHASVAKRSDLDFMINPKTLIFETVVRDFKKDHPDFQSTDGVAEGLVEPVLGPDRKPVFKGGSQLTTKANFNQWYNDVEGINKRIDFPLRLSRTTNGTFEHEDPYFFPIDGQGWMDSEVALDGNPHNFYFTLELHTKFVYTGIETFTFRGDDDVWVFIDGRLVIDLGGVHNPMERTVDLQALGLTKRMSYDLDFFFAERRCCGSSFRIETSIQPVSGECVIWGDPHVSAFDHGLLKGGHSNFNSIYDSGDYWLVKHPLVWIQGRYGPTQWTVDGQSALLALAVGGPFLQQGGDNHTLIIKYSKNHGNITWDSEQIVKDLPSEFVIKNFIRVTHKIGNRHIDQGLGGFPVELLTVAMPRMVSLTVNIWPDHLDTIIKSPQQSPSQEGHCGNFNLDAADDTSELVMQRTGMLSAEESLFGMQEDLAGVMGTMGVETTKCRMEDCSEQVRVIAEKSCERELIQQQSILGGEERVEFLDGCVFDVCCGGKAFAAMDAVTESEAAEVKSPKIRRPTKKAKLGKGDGATE